MYLSDGTTRPHYLSYDHWLKEQPAERLAQKRAEADALFHRVGITFAVYGQEEGAERLIPFDIVPRVLPLEEWVRLERGLKQRVRALNAFIHDLSLIHIYTTDSYSLSMDFRPFLAIPPLNGCVY